MSYTYNMRDNLLTASRGGATVTMTYDSAGRKLTMSDPDMGYWTYVYDGVGNLTSQTDARGCTVTMSYDLLNRLTSKSSSGTGCGEQVSTTYTYDLGTNGIGRRTSMSSGSVSNSWTYDVRGRVLSATVHAGTDYTTSWTYNDADLPVSMTYPNNGETVSFEYNDRMLLKSMVGTNSYLIVPDDGGYDSSGRLLNRTLGSGLIQNFVYYTWDQQGGRLQFINAGTSGDATSLQNLGYSYDPAGNVQQIADSVAGETSVYTYDALNRLKSWTLNDVTQETDDYNADGNLWHKGSQSLELHYDDQRRTSMPRLPTTATRMATMRTAT